LIFSLIFFIKSSRAIDISKLPEYKKTKAGLYLTAVDAYEMKKNKENVLFIDIRTRSEIIYLGMPSSVDANIPWLEYSKNFSWDEKNNRFLTEHNKNFEQEFTRRLIENGLNQNANIILICRSGSRSASAADFLDKLGFGKVYSVVDGYEGDVVKEGSNSGKRLINGWKNSGLPWSYKLNKNKMYLID
tara:strand:+ start:1183 stop:1746 length:564 start_codon:yes stop_codon:yes gene_type:complete